MRITDKMMTNSAINYMNDNLSLLNSLQEKISSTKQFQNASDNPSAAASALSLRSSLQMSQGFLDATDTTDAWMSATDTALTSMVDTARRALTLSQTGLTDTNGLDERKALASEMDMLINQAIEIGNTSHQGNYIFAGTKTTTIPFKGVDTTIPPDGLYDTIDDTGGNANTILRNVSPGQTVPQNTIGKTVLTPVMTALIAARDALNDPNTATDKTALNAAIGAIQGGLNGLMEASTTNGARQRQVQVIGDRITKSQADLKSLLSKKEDVNMAEAISNLRNQETVYQAVLEVGQRTISVTNLFQMLG
jgi:flagellar hook-associated protein 3 FlgL